MHISLQNELLKEKKMSEIFDKAVQAYETKHYNEAYSLFEELSDSNTNALVNLALMHMKGTGCKQDNVIAMKLYEKAAQKNNTQALYSLGNFYEKGIATNVDVDKACEYYSKAADAGHVDSQLKAGLLYRQVGNIIEAMRYLITAAHNNSAQAQSIITYVSNSDIGGIKNQPFHSLGIYAQQELIKNMITQKIIPTLSSDGGGINLVNYIPGDKPQIWLNYLGACSGCQLGSTSTADMLLDHFETMIDKNVILYLM